MKFLQKTIPMLLAVCALSAGAQDNAEHRLAPSKTLNFIEAGLALNYPSTPDAQILKLSIPDAEKLLASAERDLWAPFGSVAPDCGPPPVATGKTKAEKAEHLAKLKAFNADCAKLKKLCEESTKFSARHGVSAACSPLYDNSNVYLTRVENHQGYENPYEAESMVGPGNGKPPIK